MKKKRALADSRAIGTGWESLEEELANKMGNQMARDIDREVMWSMLKSIGWTRVMLSRLQDNKHAVDIKEWLAVNCQGSYECRGRDFIFEKDKDAVNFILRWHD
jgi:hypothetical protein